MTYTPYGPPSGPVPPEGSGGGSQSDKIRENRIVALNAAVLLATAGDSYGRSTSSVISDARDFLKFLEQE